MAPPNSPFGPLDRADVRQFGRVVVYDTADSVVIKLPARKSIFAIILYSILMLVFPFFILIGAGVFMTLFAWPIYIFGVGWLLGMVFALYRIVIQLCWTAFGVEWIRVTRDKLEVVRLMALRKSRSEYDPAFMTEMQTRPDFGFFKRCVAQRQRFGYSCPARFKEVQFKYKGHLKGLGQDLNAEDRWKLYHAIVGRYPNYCAK